ncbi:hypothetical protein [Caudoviricetes sp.]|nr:hypothetical protein [Caudoviricetes sp.]UOF81897.1 hypothetical protein [Caudoviricetes sp.]
MRYLTLLMFMSCAGVPPGRPQSNDCGIRIVEGANRAKLMGETLAERLGRMLDVMTLTTDYRLMEPLDVCQKMVGYRIYTREENNWQDPYGRTNGDGHPLTVAGLTSCINKTIEIGAPPLGDWNKSSLVHELFHVAQGCEALQPATGGKDADHANWSRDGIDDAIEKAYAP